MRTGHQGPAEESADKGRPDGQRKAAGVQDGSAAMLRKGLPRPLSEIVMNATFVHGDSAIFIR